MENKLPEECIFDLAAGVEMPTEALTEEGDDAALWTVIVKPVSLLRNTLQQTTAQHNVI